jgi:hypothetical protein
MGSKRAASGRLRSVWAVAGSKLRASDARKKDERMEKVVLRRCQERKRGLVWVIPAFTGLRRHNALCKWTDFGSTGECRPPTAPSNLMTRPCCSARPLEAYNADRSKTCWLFLTLVFGNAFSEGLSLGSRWRTAEVPSLLSLVYRLLYVFGQSWPVCPVASGFLPADMRRTWRTCGRSTQVR